jgi:peptidoglycan hydrolase-like protein with peptidoglycan-binding domain
MKNIALIGCLLLAACGSTGTGEEPQTSTTLGLGAQGPEVQRLTEYFSKYGYFENEQLRLAFPDWAPLIGAAPSDPEVFDEQLEAAVRVYQQRHGLQATGTVDLAMLEMLETPTCGVPESAASGRDKWASGPLPWRTQRNLTYSINNIPNPLGQLSSTSAIQRITFAFARWSQTTGITFTRQDGSSANIQVSFGRSDGRLGSYAVTDPFTGEIWFDPAENWDFGRNTDLFSVAMHELGHSLGLDHSSVETLGEKPLMWPSMGQNERRDVTGDDFDALAISAYTRWLPLPGRKATDIGSGNHQVNSGHGETFITSNEPHAHGFQLYYQNPLASFAWEAIDGGAVRLDLAGRIPWVVTSGGHVYSRANVTDANPKGSLWFNHGDPNATDIGANRGGVVWIVDNVRVNDHGNRILRWDGGTTWTAIDGGALRIDVAPNGAPYVLTGLGHLYSRAGVTAANRLGTGWTRITGHPATLTDLAIDPSPRGVLWVAAGGANGGAYQWNVQSPHFNTSGNQDAPGRNLWVRAVGSGGFATQIAVGGYGRPVIVDTSSNVSWRLPPQD